MSKIYTIKKERHSKEELTKIFKEHEELKFVSLVAMDFSGNGTDEKIPIEEFMESFDNSIKYGVQTDGSSVVLKNIATIDDAKVILVPDLDCDWFVDYDFFDEEMTGTILIPSFLVYGGEYICSRSILKRAVKRVEEETLKFIINHKSIKEEIGVSDIQEIVLTAATELEFWVKTPEDAADEEKLSASQILKEQYWKRTEGVVRTALEKLIHIMSLYDFKPEMGHKEVGGVPSAITARGTFGHIMEQLEVDWKYDSPMLACDKEYFIRHLVKEVFYSYGLETTFKSKPIEKVAGSGKHLHIGIGGKNTLGEFFNLFSHRDSKEYMTSIGFSSLMGILKNYEVITPFVAWSNDAIRRLKPNFEAPVAIVSSLGRSPENPSRNRSVLIGLIKDENNNKATRFELRSPSPHNNTYLVLAACYQAMIDGYKAGYMMDLSSLNKEFSKKEGEDAQYLEASREYRSEKNIFLSFSERERERKFGVSPKTVYESALMFDNNPEKLEVLKAGGVFTERILKSYESSIMEKWVNELKYHTVPDARELVRDIKTAHRDCDATDLDIMRWKRLSKLKRDLMKDDLHKKSLLTRLLRAIERKDYAEASELKLEIDYSVRRLKRLYSIYLSNLMEI